MKVSFYTKRYYRGGFETLMEPDFIYLFKVYLSRDRYKNIDNLEQSSDVCIIVFLAKANSRHLSLVGLLIKIIIQVNIIKNRKIKITNYNGSEGEKKQHNNNDKNNTERAQTKY